MRLLQYFIKTLLISIYLIIIGGNHSILAQDTIKQAAKINDSLKIKQKEALTAKIDSFFLKPNYYDTLKPRKSNPIESKITYKSTDSLRFNIKNRMVYLFEKADISYQQINLKANYVDMNFAKNEVFAKGVEDSTGILQGNPIFKEGDKNFDSKELLYNFNSKKGLIKQVITKESEGYIHGEKVKKMADNVSFIRNGSFTTCDLEHPHFDIRFGRAKVIPDKKIVTGPAFLYLEDIPTPLFVPLGYFPNTKHQSSGILFPTYGESANRGFFFENGGYYFALSDYVDLALRGDIYTRGSWALRSFSNYNKRYKYNGSFSFDYASNVYGEEKTPEYSKSSDFSVRWSHNQDAKARPNSRFSANVNLVSSKFNQFSQNATDFLTNTTTSSISYSTNFNGNYFLTIDLGESYNNNTKIVDLNLPTIALNVNRFYPFRKKTQSGDMKWYEDISINYALNAQNKINSHDSILFTQTMIDNMQNGIRHSIPISSNIKILSYFTLTNSINIGERWYFKTIKKEWSNDTLFSGNDTIIGYIKTTDNKGFARAMDFVLSSSLNTRLYGMVQFKGGPVRALRHVITPNVSLSWRPDFSTPFWGYYDNYTDNLGKVTKYSKFENALYGGPDAGKYGNISFSIGNNLEMKIRSKKDTITGTKKIVLIESFNLSTSYNMAIDSLNWAPVSMSGRTTLFKNIFINYNSVWDPYIKTNKGSRINQYEWDINRRILRLDNTQWNVSLNLNLNSASLKKKKTADTPLAEGQKPQFMQNPVSNINENLGDQVNFEIPWTLNIAYSFNYSSIYDAVYINYNKKYIQTLSFSGDVNITSKWKLGFRSGYDFELKDFSYSSFDIYRDLHCWEMRFNWIPFGFRQSWSFTINVKASVLKDLKWDKKKDFRDNAQY